MNTISLRIAVFVLFLNLYPYSYGQFREVKIEPYSEQPKFGSAHVGIPVSMAKDSTITSAILRCDSLYFEIKKDSNFITYTPIKYGDKQLSLDSTCFQIDSVGHFTSETAPVFRINKEQTGSRNSIYWWPHTFAKYTVEEYNDFPVTTIMIDAYSVSIDDARIMLYNIGDECFIKTPDVNEGFRNGIEYKSLYQLGDTIPLSTGKSIIFGSILPDRMSATFQVSDLSTSENRYPFSEADILDSLINNASSRYIIIDFYGSWCAPCRSAIPVLHQLYEDYDIEIITVDCEYSGDEFEMAKQQLVKSNVDWRIIQEVLSLGINNLLNIHSFPTYYIIDTTGKLICKTTKIDEIVIQLNKLGAERVK